MKLAEMIDEIRSLLGEPIIKVELSDKHIEQQIRYAVKKFIAVAWANQRDFIDVVINDGKLTIEKAVNVTSVTQQNNPVEFNWSSLNRVLYVVPKSKVEPRFLIQYEPDFNNIDLDTTYVLDNQWVLEYSVAKTKFMWGNVVGKYSSSLVNDVQINYDRIISEAQQEIERLEEELKRRWVLPAPVIVG